MPLSIQERTSRAGRASAASMTPEQRRERARKAHLASAVNAVVARAPELTPDQAAKLRAVFGTAAGSAGQRAA
ncbi:hypothetical protein AB0869_00975 [Micromonospora vinacea]|uniref:hypothetical protein n=1 Tax=Micromonospora vinacea TaxID=709878 RepID=UPI0034569585